MQAFDWKYNMDDVIDEIIREIFEIIDTYFDEIPAAKIKDLLVSSVDKGLIQILQNLADKRQ